MNPLKNVPSKIPAASKLATGVSRSFIFFKFKNMGSQKCSDYTSYIGFIESTMVNWTIICMKK